jgi:hypothetical protein
VEHGTPDQSVFCIVLEEIAIFIAKTANRLEIDTDTFLFRQTMQAFDPMNRRCRDRHTPLHGACAACAPRTVQEFSQGIRIAAQVVMNAACRRFAYIEGHPGSHLVCS